MADAQLAGELAAAVGELLAALPPEALGACRFAHDDALRTRWDSGPNERAGVQLRAMPPEARHLVYAALACAHSPHGLRAILRIHALEAVLRAREGGSAHRHPERYWLQVFGDPGAASWALRLEGHHCSVNLAARDGTVRATPLFRATNPARVPDGPQAGLRVLGAEEDAGRAAALALTPAERAACDADRAASMDLLTGVSPRLTTLPTGGALLRDLAPPARSAVDRAIDRWIDHLHPTLAAELRARLAPRRDALRFAFSGATASGQPHSWRVVGSGLVLEFAMAQDGGNHIHAVLREPDGDFGG
ncbi:MAG TPA: DUF3500 domain-containing protein [Planctomycetota bacterium]|nr:DUF3500 domain-containing protein [Planctomycetota bacterium]